MRLTILGSGGSGGIPLPFCNCKVCSSNDIFDKRLRSSYLLELNNTKILLELSPDFRQQILNLTRKINLNKEQQTLNNPFDYIFLSHLHFDHILGLQELRQSFIIEEVEHKPLNIIMPYHLVKKIKNHDYFFNNENYDESFYSAFFELTKENKISIKTIKAMEWFEINDIKAKIINNIHGEIISSSILFKTENESFLYLADASKLDQEIYEIIDELNNGLDYILVHTPFVFKREYHIGIDNVINLNAKNFIVSHFSHKARLTHKEIENLLKTRYPNKNIIIARDNLTIETNKDKNQDKIKPKQILVMH